MSKRFKDYRLREIKDAIRAIGATWVYLSEDTRPEVMRKLLDPKGRWADPERVLAALRDGNA